MDWQISILRNVQADEAVVIGQIVDQADVFQQSTHLGGERKTIVFRIVDAVEKDLDIVGVLVPGVDVYADLPG